MLEIIGKAKFYNFPAYLAWHETLTKEQAMQLWQSTVHAKQSELGRAYENTYTNFNGMGFDSGNQHRREKLKKFQDYLEMVDLPWDVRYAEGNLMVISYGQCDENTKNKENQFLIENWQEYIDYTPFNDYTGIPMAQLRQVAMLGSNGITGGSSLIPQGAGVNLSVQDVRQGIRTQEQALADLQAKVKAIENGETEELSPLKKKMDELKAQMEALQEQRKAELSVLKAELEAKKKEMEKQIFILESEIYSIRCFLGETVQFVKLRSGRNAPLEQPVVLYQKMRFMVEDLKKFSIMYPGEKIGKSVEAALQNSDLLLEAFAPSTKCITLIRYSETGKVYRMHEEELNCLDAYELLHGNQLAIIIRNGENLYIGWTDEAKITLKDDFFLKPTEAKTEAMPAQRPGESDHDYGWRIKRIEEEMERENKKNAMEGLARHFLFSVLNGVSASENSILPLPKFSSKMERNRHILFSMADGALVDRRFGSFGDIISRCNASIRKGDMLLMTMTLHAEKVYGATHYTAWYNDRGRGDRNRTHDVSASDCTIYPVNLVEYDKPVKMKRYVWRRTDIVEEYVEGELVLKQVQKETINETEADTNLIEECEVLEYFEKIPEHYFISLRKEGRWWMDDIGPSYANFEVFKSEFLNLSFFNSVWLNYVLSTKDISGWRVGGTAVNYEYALRYLGKALEFVREREKAEAENIRLAGGEAILADPDWPVALSEWKLDKGVRNITEYQAKRFVKAMLAGEVDTSPKPAAESNLEA